MERLLVVNNKTTIVHKIYESQDNRYYVTMCGKYYDKENGNNNRIEIIILPTKKARDGKRQYIPKAITCLACRRKLDEHSLVVGEKRDSSGRDRPRIKCFVVPRHRKQRKRLE